jgi:magnesium transporter
VVEALEERLEELEDEIFDVRVTRRTTERIYAFKRDLLALRRAVTPLVDVCSRVMRYDISLIPDDTKPYFRDVYDHVLRLNEMIDNVRELVTTALEANLSLASVAQQEDTRRLAAWAAIIAVPTMIAGVYGMNFEFMPELQWRFGYPLVMASTAALCVALYVGFKRSGWL